MTPNSLQVMAAKQTFSVPDISCEHCVAAITEGVAPLAGVDSVIVDIEAKAVTVTGGDHAAVMAAIVEAGYDVETAPMRSAAIAEQQIDNGVVRVTKWTFPPGSETGAHVHAFDYVVVPVTNGTLTIESGQSATTNPIEIGVSYSRAKGVAHNVANVSDHTVAFVEIELLDS